MARITKEYLKENGEFFQAQNIIFKLDIPYYEKLVYLCLVSHNNKSGDCFPSYKTIAKECSISKSLAFKAIKNLTEKQYIEKTKIKNSFGDYDSNHYTVNILGGSVPETLPSTPQTLGVVYQKQQGSVPETTKQYPYNNNQCNNKEKVLSSLESKNDVLERADNPTSSNTQKENVTLKDVKPVSCSKALQELKAKRKTLEAFKNEIAGLMQYDKPYYTSLELSEIMYKSEQDIVDCMEAFNDIFLWDEDKLRWCMISEKSKDLSKKP